MLKYIGAAISNGIVATKQQISQSMGKPSIYGALCIYVCVYVSVCVILKLMCLYLLNNRMSV